jgi:hypothetical protein
MIEPKGKIPEMEDRTRLRGMDAAGKNWMGKTAVPFRLPLEKSSGTGHFE